LYFTEHNFASEYAYIQGQRQGLSPSKWVFDDGTDMNYLPWAISQPNNEMWIRIILLCADRNLDCGMMLQRIMKYRTFVKKLYRENVSLFPE